MNWTDWAKSLLALCLWREARGEGREGMQAVANVIRTRTQQLDILGWPPAYKYIAVVCKRLQFSSITAPGDPTLVQWPVPGDGAFETAMDLASNVDTLPDITNGATHYFNPSVVLPKWAAAMTKVASIGHHDFYK